MDGPIRTSRLDLVPMTPAFLNASLVGDRSLEESLLGAAIPSDWPDQPHWVRKLLEALRTEPDLQPWLGRAVVLRSERRMIGHAGFHTRPGDASLNERAPGGVELGYTVFEKDRRHGYAREACMALMNWANRLHGVTHFVVSIGPANMASLELARGLGFERIGSRLDEKDGIEDIFMRIVDAGATAS